jgi:hypothetical protein
MPVPLPPHFELSVEILASVTDLAKVHIAGHRLMPDIASAEPAAHAPGSPIDAESWHQVRLRCDRPELSLWIDGRKAPGNLKPDDTTDLLTFESGPERPTRFRNLVVEW